MILITKPNATEPQIEHIIERIAQWGLRYEVTATLYQHVCSGVRLKLAYEKV